ncbi:hypothetical protein MMPV_001710 [Pyropia vietnamensis]
MGRAVVDAEVTEAGGCTPARTDLASGRRGVTGAAAGRATDGTNPVAGVATSATTAGEGAAAGRAASELDDEVGTTSAAVPPSTRKGRGLSWTEEERRVLCRAVLDATMDPRRGTSQRGEEYWGTVEERFRAQLPTTMRDYEKRLQRSNQALQKEFKYNIRPQVNKLNESYVAVLHRKLTGAPTEEQLILAAVAHYNGCDPYDGIRGTNPDATKCDWVGCWRILRTCDKFSAAAGEAAVRARARATGATTARVAAEGHDSEEDDPVLGLRKRVGGFQERPIGNKAAKAAFRHDAELQREARANTAALRAIAKSAEDRSNIAFWSSPAAARLPEADQWYRMEARRRLAAASAEAETAADAAVGAAPLPPVLATVPRATPRTTSTAAPRSAPSPATQALTRPTPVTAPLGAPPREDERESVASTDRRCDAGHPPVHATGDCALRTRTQRTSEMLRAASTALRGIETSNKAVNAETVGSKCAETSDDESGSDNETDVL